MTTKFRRRVGAAADVKELEYVSALHQTCMPHLREDGTVSSTDVVRFLKSRVGLIVPEEHGLRIVRGLGGGLVGDDVIEQILKEARETPKDQLEKREKRNIMDRMRLAQSLGALRKRLLHQGKGSGQTDSNPDDVAVNESLIEEAEKAHVLAHLGGSIDDLDSVERLSLHSSVNDNKARSVASSNAGKEVNVSPDKASSVGRGISPEKATSFGQEVELSPEKTAAEQDSTPPTLGDPENPTDTTKNAKHEEYLDLVQIMGILLMPTLARAGKEWHDARLQQQEEAEEEPPSRTYKGGLKGWAQKLYDTYMAKEKIWEEKAKESLRPKPENIIPDVLSTMLKSIHHNGDEPPMLDASLVRNLLIMHGECERAADPILIDKMVEAATCPSGLLDEEAFVTALTGDLGAWEVGAEDRNTTSFYDVWGYANYHEKAMLEVEQEAAEKAAREAMEQVDEEEQGSGQAAKSDNDDHSELESEDAGFHLPKSYKLGSSSSKAAKKDDEDNSVSSAPMLTGSSSKVAKKDDEDNSVSSAPMLTDEALNLAKQAGTGGVQLVKGAGTGGVNLAKEAGAGGANLVKGAEAGGVKEWKAEQKQWADTGVVKFVDKLLSPVGQSAHILESEDQHPSSRRESDYYSCASSDMTADEVEKEVAADEANKQASRPPKDLRFRWSRKSTASKPASDSTGDGTTSENADDKSYKMNHRRSLVAIDSATDVYSSSLLMIGIYIFFICTSLVYAILFQQMAVFEPNCDENFGCLLVDKIITWCIFAVFLSLVGYFVIIPLSTGNNPVERSPLLNFVAFIIALVITWIPYAAVETYKERRVEYPYDQPEKTVQAKDYSGAQWVTRVVGCIVAGLILIQFFLAVIGNRRIRQAKWLSKVLLTSVAKGSARSKRAATRKINKLLQNASSMSPKKHEAEENSNLDISEEVMINFVIRGEAFEDCGGMIWTWTNLFSGVLYEEEGVWIMSRLLVIQTIQALFIGFKTYALTLFIKEVIRRCQEWQDNLRPDLPQWVYNFVPTPREASIALWPAFAVAVMIMFIIFFVYLPSYVRRVIQFRCGIIPSLKSDLFYQYRKSVDLVYMNIGAALYAMFGAAILFFFIISLVIFLFIWPFSQDFMLTLLAWGLGLGIAIGIKYVITVFWRYCFYAGFYRTRPMRANMTQLALECWYIGLGGGVLVSRFCQFILAACFFVGRTDVPFLSADVSMFGYIFDYCPQSFVKDILVHEAHRHPYIERLLAMYMMKLKNDSFGSEAGACWRQLFVAALMPWFVRLRVFSDERLGAFREEYNTRRREGQSPLQISQQTGIQNEEQSLLQIRELSMNRDDEKSTKSSRQSKM